MALARLFDEDQQERDRLLRLLPQADAPTVADVPYDPGPGVMPFPVAQVPSAAPGTRYALEGYERSKLTPQYARTSPKYAWGLLAQQYGVTPETLTQAQRQYPQFFGAWTLDRDILRYDPSRGALHPAFQGLTAFDVARDYGGATAPQWSPVRGARPATRRVMPGDPDYNPALDGPRRNGYLVPVTQAPQPPPGGIPGLPATGGPGLSYPIPPLPSAETTQFTDPLTQRYEQLLEQQTALYRQQQEAMAAEANRQQAARAAMQAQVEQLMSYLRQRSSELQQPAYTGAEREVFRTQALDPIERDRQAARARALQQISARGFDPSSGLAQELLNLVDRAYDAQRAGVQNELAYRQITEERSREQEAQALLQSLAQLPLAVARGDVDFINQLNALIATPGQQALTTAGTLAELPVQRTQLGLDVLGRGSTPLSTVPGLLALLEGTQRQQLLRQSQAADYWRNLGLQLSGVYA